MNSLTFMICSGVKLRDAYGHVICLVHVLDDPILEVLPLLIEELGVEVTHPVVGLAVRAQPVWSLRVRPSSELDTAHILDQDACFRFALQERAASGRVSAEFLVLLGGRIFG
jgi:hypothetical protein